MLVEADCDVEAISNSHRLEFAGLKHVLKKSQMEVPFHHISLDKTKTISHKVGDIIPVVVSVDLERNSRVECFAQTCYEDEWRLVQQEYPIGSTVSHH